MTLKELNKLLEQRWNAGLKEKVLREIRARDERGNLFLRKLLGKTLPEKTREGKP